MSPETKAIRWEASMRKPIDGTGIMVMTSLCLIWGMQQLVVKATAVDISPMLQMMLRSAGAAALVWLMGRYILRDCWSRGSGAGPGWRWASCIQRN